MEGYRKNERGHLFKANADCSNCVVVRSALQRGEYCKVYLLIQVPQRFWSRAKQWYFSTILDP